jgi:FAD/FMN-containing dehydrogenase
MVAEHALDALDDLLAGWPARAVWRIFQDELPRTQPPVFEYSWNHTTLNALKFDRSITYLQTLFPPPRHLELVERMYHHFGDEVPMHLEFVRFAGQVACFGLQIVRYTDDARLHAIIDYHNENGCPIFNPHDYTLEGGGMKRVDHQQLAFKREADPRGLLNPGKMIGWDDPAYDRSEDRRFLYEG